MADLTKTQLEEFRKATKSLFRDAVTSGDQIIDLMKEAVRGLSEIIEILGARRKTVSEEGLRLLIGETVIHHKEVYDRLHELAAKLLESLKNTSAAADAATDPTANTIEMETIENLDPARVLKEAEASELFNPIIRELAVSASIMSLRTAIEAYAAANEAFLQRKPGSANPGERMEKVFRAFLKDVVGIPLPPFLETFREIVRQFTERQLKRDIAAISEETGERLYSLRRLQNIVGAYADFADYMIETGTHAAIESLENAAHAMAKAKTVLDQRAAA